MYMGGNPAVSRIAGGTRSGFSLVELLLVTVIISLIFAFAFFNAKKQIDRANDARRKGDIQKIARAFEDYYNDHGCYPPVTVLDRCGSDDLAPYLKEIPCDPITGTAYKYVYVDENDRCQGYRLFAALQDTGDPAIGQKGCSPVAGCGYGVKFNFGLGGGATGGSLTPPGFDPGLAPTPTPRVIEGPYACSAGGICQFTDNPYSYDNRCPLTFADSSCRDRTGKFMCSDPRNRCAR